jgi:hypothetical protein
MKKIFYPFLIILSFLITSFTTDSFSNKENTENWYICSYCCKTKKAKSAPWEQGCKVSSSRTHNFQFLGKSGDYNHTCRKCDAEVYLKQGTSPSASKCCETGGTHTWYNK